VEAVMMTLLLRSKYISAVVLILGMGWTCVIWAHGEAATAPFAASQRANTSQHVTPAPQADPPRPLPDADRKVLAQYLGDGVIGDPVACPELSKGFEDIIPQRSQVTWTMRLMSGPDKGKQRPACASRPQPGPDHEFKFDTGDGQNIYILSIDKSGDLDEDAEQDNQEHVITKYSPPEPMFLTDLKPGETRHVTSKISVAKLSNPQVETHSGKFEIDLTYLGAYRVSVPAGKFDVVLYKTHVKGRIGPASIDKTVYRLFAKNTGFVAMAEIEDVSAVLVYQDHTREGEVLVESKN
jgi:hypothetical protein